MVGVYLGDFVHDVAIGDKEVEVAVVVVVEKIGAKAQRFVAILGQAGALGDVVELSLPIVTVQGISLLGKVGHKNILQPVVVPIPELHPHASFGQAVLVVAPSGVEADLGKAVPLVLVEKVHSAIVGHVHVGVAV